jgi:hypothetical protein
VIGRLGGDVGCAVGQYGAGGFDEIDVFAQRDDAVVDDGE